MTKSTQTLPGGWSEWSFSIPQNVLKIFNEAAAHILGVQYYDPIAYEEQLVEGTNYKFICAAKNVLLWPETIYLAEVVIYQPLKGTPAVASAHEIAPIPHPVPGGWQNWKFPASEQAVQALEKAPHLVGVNYKPFGSTMQVVNGIYYCLVCERTYIVPNSYQAPVLVFVHQMPDGKCFITSIMPIQ